MLNFTDNWSPFGVDSYYRRQELYQMAWAKYSIDLTEFALIAAQTHGGPIAVVREERKKTPAAPSPALVRPQIVVFSAAGRLLHQWVWNSGPLLQLGWSGAEELVCVQEDGRVLIYDMFGAFVRTFGMGQEAMDARVVDCRIFAQGSGATGIAVLTGSRRFFIMHDIDAPTPILRSTGVVPGLDVNAPPPCWAVVCQERDTQILITRGSDILSVDKTGSFQPFPVRCSDPVLGYSHLAVSPNGKSLALVTLNGLIIITPTEAGALVACEFDSGSPDAPPQQVAWCGNSAVVGYWAKPDGHVLLLIGPKKDYINFLFDSPVHLVSETDCLRIISRDTHDMIQKVPATTQAVMKLGSMAPGAALLEAYREYEALSYKADEYLKLVKPTLEDAINQCIDSAGQELDINTQKLLLRAASFGKSFYDSAVLTEKFVLMCKNLRILNALRFYLVGMPLTWRQFEGLSVPELLDKLVRRRQYELAYRICGYLELPVQEGFAKILLHWSLFKMNQRNEPDEAVARAIIGKLAKTPGISFAECARKARSLGRNKLAMDLLEHETSAQLQIPLLLELGREEVALTKAIASGNSDLVYDVILHLKAKMTAAEFLMKIRSSKEVFALFIKYCKELNPGQLRDLFVQEDWRTDEGLTFVPEAFFEKLSPAERLAALQSAMERFEHGRDEFNKKITEDQIKLIKQQNKLEEKFNRGYTGLTVHQTLELLLNDGFYKMADDLKKDFQIADRHFWLVKIDVLARNAHWEELEKFSKSVRKPPVGLEHFAVAAFRYHGRNEAYKYAMRVDEENKLKCFVKIGLLEEAAEWAIKQKDGEGLNKVLEKCRRDDVALISKITAAKTQLGLA
ncbi:vacuolar protein sorting-associated protein 16 homolog [Paramacrobiotus metropolitanus]|uniref:vacuolar protein sorting-associated protein 16 homolog n=1 Tax=Paramacrobiotus metropolitanus TaxID=2943436 RepID=UPI0024464473|nr:vacuolar protein sorting-associated protein 16 homolog [Paramacrobiotus metropolitanus]